MYTARRSIDIDFAHHVRGHAGACINLHGHTWKFEICLSAHELDAQGFVLDFEELDAHVLEPCHALLDHGLALGEASYGEVVEQLEALGQRLLASRAEEPSQPQSTGIDGDGTLAGARNHFPGGLKLAVFPFAPTSERLARWLYELAVERLANERVSVACGRVYETLHPVHSVASYGPLQHGHR